MYLDFAGLVFLLHNPDLSSLMTRALNEAENLNKDECSPLRYGFTLISKGFLCRPQEVATNVEMHIRVVCTVSSRIVIFISTSYHSYSRTTFLFFLKEN